jgi:hypothetical protein
MLSATALVRPLRQSCLSSFVGRLHHYQLRLPATDGTATVTLAISVLILLNQALRKPANLAITDPDLNLPGEYDGVPLSRRLMPISYPSQGNWDEPNSSRSSSVGYAFVISVDFNGVHAHSLVRSTSLYFFEV